VAIIDSLRQSPNSELAFFSRRIEWWAIPPLLLSVGDTSDPVKLETTMGAAKLRLTYASGLMNRQRTKDTPVRDVTDASVTNAPERLITVAELAGQLRYSTGWVRAHVKAGEIPCIRFNSRAWRFHWPTVLAALRKL
jgi:hypothetical protein